jgi:hypothetical protein
LKHPAEIALSLFATGDLAWMERWNVRLHLARCAGCRELVDAYRSDREWVREESAELPEGVDWARLSAEMTANIRVGLAAGECVAPRRAHQAVSTYWKPAAAMAGLSAVLAGAWWLNVPSAENESLLRVLRAIGQRGMSVGEERGPVVIASPAGIQLRENGGSLEIAQPGMRPVNVSIDAQGSASARYVDSDTGQVTITSVYVQ